MLGVGAIAAVAVATGAFAASGSTEQSLHQRVDCSVSVTEDPNANVIRGTKGRDRIVGTPGDDVILGLAGNDKIIGRGGDDIILGGPGNDRIFGQAGIDRANGGAGSDFCRTSERVSSCEI